MTSLKIEEKKEFSSREIKEIWKLGIEGGELRNNFLLAIRKIRKNWKVVVAKEKEEIIGWCMIWGNKNKSIGIFVKENKRRNKIGTRLIENILRINEDGQSKSNGKESR